MVRRRYSQVVVRGGVVCVRDRQVLRRVTMSLREDPKLMSKFAEIPSPSSFHADDLERVYFAYLHRVETMMGNEVSWKLMEMLRLNNMDQLGSLRKLKLSENNVAKGVVNSGNEGVVSSGNDTGVSKGGKKNAGKGGGKKRKRRKKKGW